MSLRRVVVTGIGAITPLGVGARRSWRRLLAGDSGIQSISHLEPRSKWKDIPSTVAGLVPTAHVLLHESGGEADGHQAGVLSGLWRPSDWLDAPDQRRMPTFCQYAAAAAEMALDDAGWRPTVQDDLEATGICLGSGIGNLDETYSTSLAYEKDVRYNRS